MPAARRPLLAIAIVVLALLLPLFGLSLLAVLGLDRLIAALRTANRRDIPAPVK
jgi:uncharacterized iron-regulated membrane protein